MMRRFIPLCAALLLITAAALPAQSSSSYRLAFDVFDNGGRVTGNSSGSLDAHSIIGQAAVLHTTVSAGYEASSGAACLFCDRATGTAVRSAMLPMIMRLYQNYPNPFNPSTTIRYALERGGTVELAVYNLLGERVAMLVEEYQDPGDYTLEYDASALQSGVYIYRLKSEHGQLTRRMVLMK
ncbi:MAG: T9SS type A sorting domain-containing protein [Bacteroidota bacterium]|nr:T9SS type A sorting domain-containing protein [Bacteroidota bacterium]